ncbi:VPA1269 family protein [Idiomarina ramblicola]|uniref:Integrase n=1 Tax=Idiomarina ramblicola TaxID=263724 RepID=A0A432YY67_9GAMM|nr:VPA1269 family protein [Idiomarina ramblicola]RUO68346.1 hypothetical protein CWI78_09000 [Idiomarina ramblicola]
MEVKDNKLTYDENITFIANNLDILGSEFDLAVKKVKDYAESNPDARPLTDIFHTFNSSSTHVYKMNLASFLKKQEAIESIIFTAKKLNCLSASKATRSGQEASLRTFSWVVIRLNEASSIAEISENELVNTLLQVKTELGTFEDKFPERYQQSARHLAKVLNSLDLKGRSGKCFFSIVSVPRGVRPLIGSGSQKKMNVKWHEYFEDYLGTLLLASTKEPRAAFKKFIAYLALVDAESDPEAFLCNLPNYSFLQFLEDNKIRGIKPAATLMYDFCEHIIREHLTIREDGEDTTLARQLLSPSEYDRVIRNKIRKGSKRARPSESTKEIMPTKLILMCKDILVAEDYKWPKSLSSQYFYRVDEGGNQIKTWCPSITNLILLLLELPLRKIQAKSLDSGEGDEYEYDVSSQSWVQNKAKHAGYWADSRAVTHSRGFLRRKETPQGDSLVLYINTNKTQDREHGFSELSGYEIPWKNNAVIDIVKKQMDWLSTYHPVDAPQDFASLPRTVFSKDPTKAALELIPDRFYLFRCMLNSYHATDGPPQEHLIVEFWNQLMLELNSRLKELGESFDIITKKAVSNNSYISIYTPHGLRVAGLTSFYKAGVPIEILSKLVAGHKSIFMTFYYLKLSSEDITETLTSARKKIENNQQSEFKKFLLSTSYKEAEKYIHTQKHFPSDSWDSIRQGLWEVTNLGICPNSGTKCKEGGPMIKKESKSKPAIFGPVEGGDGNCIRCRFLITGRPFLIPLFLYGNKLLADALKLSAIEEKHRNSLEDLYSQRAKFAKDRGFGNIPEDLKVEINATERLVEKSSVDLDNVLNNLHPTHKIISSIRKGISESNDLTEYQGDTQDDIGYEDISKFKQMNCLVQAARLYPHIVDPDLERERDQFIDKVLFQLGKTPISFAPLTDDEKRAAADAFGNYLISRLSDSELTALESNQTVSLETLITDTKFKELTDLGSSDMLLTSGD